MLIRRGPAGAGRLESACLLRGDDGNRELTEADRTEWQEAQVSKLCGQAGLLYPAFHPVGAVGLGQNQTEKGGTRPAGLLQVQRPSQIRPVSRGLCWVRAPRPLQTQAAKLVPTWAPQTGTQLASGEGSSVVLSKALCPGL